MKKINKKLKIIGKKIGKFESKLAILNHISKKNCALLPFLDEESLHSLGEFVYNVITQRIKLNNHQQKRVKRILNKSRDFYVRLVSKHTKNPVSYFKSSLKSNPQVGQGIISLIATLAPLISSLLFR